MPWEFPVLAFIAGNQSLQSLALSTLRILTRALMTVCEVLFAEESDLYLDALATWLALLSLTHVIRIQPRR
ncbi:hypothetical protein M405DRAFT_816881 [Rhizopogon salebrosus TDB-379]|nr:hypothetical protein M405DRAFT_816881 [Rhizopogon salebrosus TDB-379]